MTPYPVQEEPWLEALPSPCGVCRVSSPSLGRSACGEGVVRGAAEGQDKIGAGSASALAQAVFARF